MDRHISHAKKEAYERLMAQYEAQCKDIEEQFLKQQEMLESKFKNDNNDYIRQSYFTYVTAYNEIGQNIQQNIKRLQKQELEQNEVIKAKENRVKANKQINKTINEFLKNIRNDENLENIEKIQEFADQITECVKSDKLLIGRQYISYDEALKLLESA
jgi:predicted MarR family transcription regulator